jgi:hypothetical protein
MINRYRMFLQVISTYDVLLFNKSEIHPAYLNGCRPPSRTSLFLWPPIPCLPKKFWGLWGHFLRFYVTPKLAGIRPLLGHITTIRYLSNYYKHHHSHENELSLFKLARCQRKPSPTTYVSVPYICDLIYNDSDFFPVDVHISSMRIQSLGRFPIHPKHDIPDWPLSINDAFASLLASLCCIL